MASNKDADRLSALLAKSGLNDAFYVKLFGVNQSTISRLRHGKILKVQRYISLLEAEDALTITTDREFADIVRQLVALANERPTLRRLLASMHHFLHETMHDVSHDA